MPWLSENRIDRPLDGPALTIGDRAVRPLARVVGWRWPGGLVAAIVPVAVEVVAADGRRARVPITTGPMPIWPLLLAAALVAVGGSLARRAIARKEVTHGSAG
jgi:hypothetical protein